VFSEMPGDCSPSRSVVSKISTRFGSCSADMSLLFVSSCFFSAFGSRLYAAAHALFPPRGEEKKSKIEWECHRRED
jgi:hypothetical protein